MRHLLAQTLMIMAVLVARAEHPRAKFISLIGQPGHPSLYAVYHLSGDGHVVIGEAPPTNGPHGEGAAAVRDHKGAWSIHNLGLFPANPNEIQYSPAFGISRHGEVIAGSASYGDPTVDVAWASYLGNPPIPLEMFPGDVTCVVSGVSSSGRVLVGWGLNTRNDRFEAGTGYRHALLWTGPGIPPLEIDNRSDKPPESLAVEVAREGKVIVGFAQSERSRNHPFLATDARGHEAIVWRKDEERDWQRIWLGALPDHPFHSRALGVSDDGERVIGRSGVDGDNNPVLWTIKKREHHTLRVEMKDLGVLPGFSSGAAFAISGNGKVIVGACQRFVMGSFDSAEAFVWTEEHGLRLLSHALKAAGAKEVVGWTLVTATGVSEDGHWICGEGSAPNDDYGGWVAWLP